MPVAVAVEMPLGEESISPYLGAPGWQNGIEPLTLTMLAVAIGTRPTALVSTLITALRNEDEKLEMFRRYISGDPTMGIRDRMDVLVEIMAHVGVAYPTLYIRFIVPHSLAQISETFDADLHDRTADQGDAAGIPDITIMLSNASMAMYARRDLFNCGESNLRRSPGDVCYMCYEPDHDGVFTACESYVCDAQPCGRHALMCVTCMHDYPLARYRRPAGL
jgi:hypothetical protein